MSVMSACTINEASKPGGGVAGGVGFFSSAKAMRIQPSTVTAPLL